MGTVEVRVSTTELSEAEKVLFWGVCDEGGVEGSVFPEAVVNLEPGERNAGAGLPKCFVLLCGGLDSGDFRGFTGSWFSSFGE